MRIVGLFVSSAGVGCVMAGIGGFIGWFLFARDTGQTASAVIAVPASAFVDGSQSGERGKLTFKLTNRGPRTVTIRAVEHTCSCIETTDLRGRVLAPSESCDLGIRIDIPASGVDVQKLQVWHDGDPAPVILTMEVLGRRPLPYIVNKESKQVTFFELDSAAATQRLRVVTCEPVDHPAWLAAISSNQPELTVERVGLEERRAGKVIERHYEFRIGWRALPRGPEFHGRLWCATSYGSPSEVEVGIVAGTRTANDDYSPKTARLTASAEWADAIIFRKLPEGFSWDIATGWSAPLWLSLNWEEYADRRILRIRVANGTPPPSIRRIGIPLSCQEGCSTELPVEIDIPSKHSSD
jgi:hypothetical protein